MERNLDRRVEVLCPVLDPESRHYLLHEVLGAYLRDDTSATVLQADGRYEPVRVQRGTVHCQQRLMARKHPNQSR
jgi:polyphosphate kinase